MASSSSTSVTWWDEFLQDWQNGQKQPGVKSKAIIWKIPSKQQKKRELLDEVPGWPSSSPHSGSPSSHFLWYLQTINQSWNILNQDSWCHGSYMQATFKVIVFDISSCSQPKDIFFFFHFLGVQCKSNKQSVHEGNKKAKFFLGKDFKEMMFSLQFYVTKVLFHSDLVFFFLNIVFGLSRSLFYLTISSLPPLSIQIHCFPGNGYICNICMMCTPKMVVEPKWDHSSRYLILPQCKKW